MGGQRRKIYQTFLIKSRHDRNEFSVYLQKLNYVVRARTLGLMCP